MVTCQILDSDVTHHPRLLATADHVASLTSSATDLVATIGLHSLRTTVTTLPLPLTNRTLRNKTKF